MWILPLLQIESHSLCPKSNLSSFDQIYRKLHKYLKQQLAEERFQMEVIQMPIQQQKKNRTLRNYNRENYLCLDILDFFNMKFSIFNLLFTLQRIPDKICPNFLQFFAITKSSDINVTIR
jgi:hypothetical protein